MYIFLSSCSFLLATRRRRRRPTTPLFQDRFTLPAGDPSDSQHTRSIGQRFFFFPLVSHSRRYFSLFCTNFFFLLAYATRTHTKATQFRTLGSGDLLLAFGLREKRRELVQPSGRDAACEGGGFLCINRDRRGAVFSALVFDFGCK